MCAKRPAFADAEAIMLVKKVLANTPAVADTIMSNQVAYGERVPQWYVVEQSGLQWQTVEIQCRKGKNQWCRIR